MTPRKYELSERAESREATKQRIVEATIALHREQGVVATSYRHVAERADVGIGTVYRHFPTLDDLVMACGGRLLEITKPPTVEAFTGVRSRRARLARKSRRAPNAYRRCWARRSPPSRSW